MEFVKNVDCMDLIASIDDGTIDLVLTDPPYFEIVDEKWDNQWEDGDRYVAWFSHFSSQVFRKLTPTGSFIFFGGIGKHGAHPFWHICENVEWLGFHFRNMITWKKRRAYGKSHDYLFCREEIAWFSKSMERTSVTFNIPYTDVLRGYDGFNKKYAAKSPYKRVSNVWDDIPELMRPKRQAQKPPALIDRLITTHSNEGDLVVDPFVGWGTTGISAINLGRRFIGSEMIVGDAIAANERCIEAFNATNGEEE